MLKNLMQGANVVRYHTVPTVGTQNNGHHSMRVCLILRHLLDGEVSAKLYEAALFHDLSETYTGDLPATTKWANRALTDLVEDLEVQWAVNNDCYVTLCEEEEKLLTIADKLELVWFCTEQMKMGNEHLRTVRQKGIDYCTNVHLVNHIIEQRVSDLIKECENECK